jgi:hypothetical protein
MRMHGSSLARAETPATRKRTEFLAAFDTLTSHLETTFTALSAALAERTQTPANSHVKLQARTLLVLALGPSVSAAKARIVLVVDGMEVKGWEERDERNKDIGGGEESGEEEEEDEANSDQSSEEDLEDDVDGDEGEAAGSSAEEPEASESESDDSSAPTEKLDASPARSSPAKVLPQPVLFQVSAPQSTPTRPLPPSTPRSSSHTHRENSFRGPPKAPTPAKMVSSGVPRTPLAPLPALVQPAATPVASGDEQDAQSMSTPVKGTPSKPAPTVSSTTNQQAVALTGLNEPRRTRPPHRTRAQEQAAIAAAERKLALTLAHANAERDGLAAELGAFPFVTMLDPSCVN